MRDLNRLLSPASVAVIGGGAWCRAVVAQLGKAGFDGPIWPVHPTAGEVDGHRAFACVDDLPGPPDAAFIGINRDATIATVGELSRIGAGGAVCFASGFAEVADGADRTRALLHAAGDMPILGPNCYGFINALDGAMLWPDQHGCTRVETGVAILTQSSNIAINLTMQTRGLPIAQIICCGNQSQTGQAEIAIALLDDPRITAIGLHIEGFGDLTAWDRLAATAEAKGIPLVALKVGSSDAARAAAVTHTASLSGGAAFSDAVLARWGMSRTTTLTTFLETLKILHLCGRLPSRDIASISCSGGEAGLMADLGSRAGLAFPALTPSQTEALSAALGPRVALANPLDYHTYVWRDAAGMTDTFAGMTTADLALTLLVIDFPRADRCDATDWDIAVSAAKAARARTGLPLALVATLPELMPEPISLDLMEAGVLPLSGLETALDAIAAAGPITRHGGGQPLLLAHPEGGTTLTEAEAKAALAACGLTVPRSTTDPSTAAALTPPLVLKAAGLAHKSDAGGVILGLTADTLTQHFATLPGTGVLIEEMVTDGVAELLIGVTCDQTGGHLLTLGAGGVLTELLADTVHLSLPVTPDDIRRALLTLRCTPLLIGYRGRPPADLDSIVGATLAVQDYVLANAGRVSEVEINPLLCTPTRAVAVDALIRTSS